MRWGKISSACLQAPQMSSAEHWRTSVWDIVCTIVGCVKMGVVERSWEIGTELSWENSDKCHNKMDCSERERREWRRDWTWRDQKNTLRKLLTAFVFYKAFWSYWRRSARWRKAAFEGQIKEESVWPKRQSAKEKKRNTWCFGVWKEVCLLKVCRLDGDPSGLWSPSWSALGGPRKVCVLFGKAWSIWCWS